MRKPFLTPPTIPEGLVCRTLQIPNSKEWLGIFNSALLEMLRPYNYEQVNDTDLTIDDTIALCNLAIHQFWATEGCLTGCALPELGTPPFRMGVDGHFEILDPVTGEWGTPAGEYAIPPTPPREESTSYERRCNAAANAAYVIGLVYEAITDEISLGGDQAQIIAATIAALVTALGGWIAAPVAAIIDLTIALFVGMIELLQVLGADVWTDGYQEYLKCLLYDCSTDAGDVVTFDYACIRENLYVGLDLLSPTVFYDAQIFAQVLFLIETITMDGLAAAGATTEIIDDDCSCGVHCMRVDFRVTNGSSVGVTIQGGTRVDGVGIQGVVSSGQRDAWGFWNFPTNLHVLELGMSFVKTVGSGANNVNKINGLYPSATGYATTLLVQDSANPVNPTAWYKGFTMDQTLKGMGFDLNSGNTGSAGTITVISIRVIYTNDIPSGWSDNCDD